MKNGDGRQEAGDGKKGPAIASRKISKFEDLEIWKESMVLATEVYAALAQMRDFGLRDQMQRSAVSVPSNIAEGYERQSNREFIKYLYIARGSCAELRTQLYLAIKLEMLKSELGQTLVEKTRGISAKIHRLIQVRNERFGS